MLQVLRDSMKYLAWILWVVIGVFVLYVFVDFGSGVPTGPGTANAAVTVGDQEISYRELEREHRELEEQYRQQLGAQASPELIQQLRLPMQALNRIINRKILVEEAERLGLQVSDQELRRFLLEQPLFQDENGRYVGKEGYERAVLSRGYTVDLFEASIREQLLLQRLLEAFDRSVVVTDVEVEKRYREQVEKAQLSYVALPFGELVGQVQVGDADIQAYFQANRAKYELPETRTAQFVLIDPRVLQESLQVPDQELRAYYDAHRDEYTEEEQVRARHILVESAADAAAAQARLAAGEDFAAVAAAVSKDASNATSGGDLGWFGKGRMVKAFEDAAFAGEPGRVIGPVQTDFGFHLIEVLEKRGAGTRPFEEVREAVRLRVAGERAAAAAEEKARTIAADLKEAGVDAAQKMTELVGQAGVETGTTEPFRQQGPVPPLGAAPALNAAGFQLAQGGVSDPIRTPRGWVILRVAEVTAPRLPELADVRDRVRADAERQKLEDLAMAQLRQAKTRLDGGATLADVAAGIGRTVESTEEFGSGTFVPGLGLAPDLVKQALAAQEGATGGPQVVGGRAVVWQVAKRTRMDPAAFATARPGLRDQLQDERVNSLLGAIVNSRKEELGVTYDPPLLQSLGMSPDGAPLPAG
jgi:peptidyl-prolyl cis-trans isomerase D